MKFVLWNSKRFRLVIFAALLIVTILLSTAAVYFFSQSRSQAAVQENNTVIPAVEQIDTSAIEENVEVEEESSSETGNNILTVGKPYPKSLIEKGSRNILIIGEDRASTLYDTIGIASINESTKTIRLIMIPRDTYIEYKQFALDALIKEKKDKLAGVYKINFAHEIGRMTGYSGKFDSGSISFLAQVIKEKFGVEADDYIKIRLDGLVELVDIFGGVKIAVPYDMNYEDPTQDLSIHIKKGLQKLDGKQSEGFLRFRKGYKADGTFFEIGDTGRKKNQLAFMNAFISQKGTLSNITKLPDFIKSLNKNLKTSIGVGDVLVTYTGLAQKVISDKYDIQTVNLTGKEVRINKSDYVIFDEE